MASSHGFSPYTFNYRTVKAVVSHRAADAVTPGRTVSPGPDLTTSRENVAFQDFVKVQLQILFQSFYKVCRTSKAMSFHIATIALAITTIAAGGSLLPNLINLTPHRLTNDPQTYWYFCHLAIYIQSRYSLIFLTGGVKCITFHRYILSPKLTFISGISLTLCPMFHRTSKAPLCQPRS